MEKSFSLFLIRYMSIKKFQKENGLVPDGIVGPKTLRTFKKVHMLTDSEVANLFGQMHHESLGMSVVRENLNYSVEGLLTVFSKYFRDEEHAKEYARNPQKIANRVYANRMGNRGEESGDGYKFLGRGYIQLTGHDNYLEFSKYIGNPMIMKHPDIVATDYALESALFFFRKNGIFNLCKDVSEETIRKVTRRVNGGYKGLLSRIKETQKYYRMLQ